MDQLYLTSRSVHFLSIPNIIEVLFIQWPESIQAGPEGISAIPTNMYNNGQTVCQSQLLGPFGQSSGKHLECITQASRRRLTVCLELNACSVTLDYEHFTHLESNIFLLHSRRLHQVGTYMYSISCILQDLAPPQSHSVCLDSNLELYNIAKQKHVEQHFVLYQESARSIYMDYIFDVRTFYSKIVVFLQDAKMIMVSIS